MKKRRKTKKKKKFLLKFLTTIFILIILIIAIYIYLKKDILEYKTKIRVEVGESIPTLKDYLYEDIDLDEEIIWSDIELKDNKIYIPGTYKGKFNYKKDEIEVILVVEDTTPPIIENVKNIEVIAHEKEPNLLEGLTATDNSMEKIEVTVEGKYNIEEVGEYHITYIAKDSSGNTSKKNIKLIVKENSNIKVSKTNKGNTIKYNYGITYIDNIIIANKTYSLPSSYVPSNLVNINGYIKVVDYVKTAFNELISDSNSIGLNIYASSGYRSYSDQKYIYNNYVKYDGQTNADTYSARAGHSEHQTGLAIDVNSVNSSFDGTDESNWLKDNCHKYGFIIRYPKGKENITGYIYEPWHIRYVGKDLAKTLYNNGDWITIEEHFGIDSKYK